MHRISESRRIEILEAAAIAFAEKGYQRATIKEIATRAGIAPGTIYLYFKNKHQLLMGIANHVIGQAWTQTKAQMARIDPEAYIDAVLQNMLHFVRQNQAFLQTVISEIWTSKELQEQFFDQIITPLFETAGRYLELQIEKGRARPCRAEIVVPTIAGSMIILTLLRTLAPDDFLAHSSDKELVDELKRLYFYGLRLDGEIS
jgi:TetR/AcrR family transcriptional regulator